MSLASKAESLVSLDYIQDVFSQFPFLPSVPAFDYDHAKDDPVKRPFADKESHPLHHRRKAWSFTEMTKYPREMEIACAMVGTSVQYCMYST